MRFRILVTIFGILASVAPGWPAPGLTANGAAERRASDVGGHDTDSPRSGWVLVRRADLNLSSQ